MKLSDKMKENYHSAFLFADEVARLEEELAARNATLDRVDEITKRLETKIDNLHRNVNLGIEQKTQLEFRLMDVEQLANERGEKRDVLYKENEALREQNELLQLIREAQANMIHNLFAEKAVE